MKNFNWPMLILGILGLLMMAALGWAVVWVLMTLTATYPWLEGVLAVIVVLVFLVALTRKK